MVGCDDPFRQALPGSMRQMLTGVEPGDLKSRGHNRVYTPFGKSLPRMERAISVSVRKQGQMARES